MGKKIRAAGLLLCLFVLFFCFAARAEETGSVPVSMEISAPYGETGKIGSYIPLRIRLYGQSDAPVSGSVCVRTLENGGNGNGEGYEYEYPFTVGTAETKQIEIYVPLGQKSSSLYVFLRDADGQELSGRLLQFHISKEMGRLLIGTLSDQGQELAYLGDVILDYGMTRSVLLPLTAETLPSDERGLEMLDVLLINDFDSSGLSGSQREAVSRWVREGGRLIFGTGERIGETTGAFGSLFPELSYEEPRLRSVSMGAEYSRETPKDASIDMVCAEITIPGGEAVLESDELTLLTLAGCGRGQVGFFSCDLAELGGFVRDNPSFGVQMLTRIMGEEELSSLYLYGAYAEDQEYWTAQNLVNGGNADRLPKLSVYVPLILVYIFMAGPGLYLFLRKRELSRYYGMSVVLLSLAASAVVWIAGIGTRFTQEFYTYASVHDLQGDRMAEQTYLNIRTPDSRRFATRAAAGYEVRPLTRSSRYDTVSLVEMDPRRSANVTLRFEDEGTELRAGRSRAFESRFFRLDRETGNPYSGKLVSELEYFDGRISGYLRNDLPFDLEGAVLFLYGQALPLGTLEAGETRTFSGEQPLVWPVGMSYWLADVLMGNTEADDVSSSEYMKTMERSGMYAWFTDRYYGAYTSELRLAAFGPAGNGLESLVSGGQVLDGVDLYTTELEASRENDELIYRSGLAKEPLLTSGSGSFYGSAMVMYSTEPLVAEYDLGSDITVEKVSFLPVSEEFFEDSSYSYFQPFSGETWFYNHSRGAYEPVDLSQRDFSGAELSEYLSADNELTVQYVSGEDEPAGTSQVLPLVMVTGRER